MTSVKPLRADHKKGGCMLTEREKDTLDYIKTYMRNTGTVPTMTEIGVGINTSAKVANDFFHRLVEKGYVRQVSGKRYIVEGMKYVDV